MTAAWRPSFIGELTQATNALRTLAIVLPDAESPDERMALLQAINRQALTIIVLVNEVLNTPRREG